jgi:N-formylglutamate amidohydrolase
MPFDPPFIRLGPDQPRHPVIISVPHAGRNYPPDMTLLTRLPAAQLQVLEDRHADSLVRAAVTAGFRVLIAQTPRAWIDLNRGERDYDPDLIQSGSAPSIPSAKVRGGLGIIPRRIQRGGDIWRGKISASAFERRLADIHRPYHTALGKMIDETRRQFGVALLIDLHSMPPLAESEEDKAPARCVIGDLFGQSSANRFSETAQATADAHGLAAALNSPYAGGYILERHGAPHSGVHALQIEIDRTLYLEERLDELGPGVKAMQRFVAALALALADEALGSPLQIAAE